MTPLIARLQNIAKIFTYLAINSVHFTTQQNVYQVLMYLYVPRESCINLSHITRLHMLTREYRAYNNRINATIYLYAQVTMKAKLFTTLFYYTFMLNLKPLYIFETFGLKTHLIHLFVYIN